MSEYYPTDHLREKMTSRNITWAEILEVVERPEVTFGPDDKGRQTHQKGDLCVVVGRNRAVITVLLRQQQTWSDEQVASRKITQLPHRRCNIIK